MRRFDIIEQLMNLNAFRKDPDTGKEKEVKPYHPGAGEITLHCCCREGSQPGYSREPRRQDPLPLPLPFGTAVGFDCRYHLLRREPRLPTVAVNAGLCYTSSGAGYPRRADK